MRVRATPVLLALALVGAGCAGTPDPEPAIAQLTARPLEEELVREPEPSARIPSPSAPATPSPSPTVDPSPPPTGPTEADKARFAAGYAPAGSHGVQHVALDLDLDGIEELLFTFVRERRSHVEIAAWDGAGYRVVASATGGRAQRVERVRVGDVNADGRTEIVVHETDETGSSLSVLAVNDDRTLAGLRARGGCYDGSATYGVVGAELRDTNGDAVPEIVARCDDSPLPVSAWSEAVYRWEDGAYRVVESGPLDGGDDEDDDDDDDDHAGRGRGGGDRGRGNDD